MASIHVDIVSAEGEIFSGEADMVFAPGQLGELGEAAYPLTVDEDLWHHAGTLGLLGELSSHVHVTRIEPRLLIGDPPFLQKVLGLVADRADAGAEYYHACHRGNTCKYLFYWKLN